MISLEEMKSKGQIPECYQSVCKCGHSLYTNTNMTYVTCLNEQCIFRSGSKLAYALKVIGIKSVGVQKSIDLVDFPGIQTHMDIFSLKDHKIVDVDGNSLMLPVIPLTADKSTNEVSFIFNSKKYRVRLQEQLIAPYEMSTGSRIVDSNAFLNLLFFEILPSFRRLKVDLLLYGEDINNVDLIEEISNKRHLNVWIAICNSILEGSGDRLFTNSRNPDIITSFYNLRVLDDKMVNIQEIVDINEVERDIIEGKENHFYENNWIVGDMLRGYETIKNAYDTSNIDNNKLDTILLDSLYRISRTILNDGGYFNQLIPIIQKMNELNSTVGIHLHKFMQMWNFSSIGETYTQKIFMEFSTIEEFYDKFETQREMAKYIASKLGIESYTDTVINICNTMEFYKEDIQRVSKSFKFRPAVKGLEPILVTITNSITTRNPHTGEPFSPRESFIDFCIEEYGVPIIYKKSYTSDLKYIIADDRSGGNKKLTHTDKIISSSDFIKTLIELKSGEDTSKDLTSEEDNTLLF